MSKPKSKGPAVKAEVLFDRVVSILEQARSSVVRAVNTNMVLAYWLIGREIVEEVQSGKERAKYGEKVIGDLSTRLTERYGLGYSVPNLKNFRQFYQSFPDRCARIGYPVGSQLQDVPISRPSGMKSGGPRAIPHPPGGELRSGKKGHTTSDEFKAGEIPYPAGTELVVAATSYPVGSELTYADVGQMDGYVRMYDGLFTAPDDNPTIGLILCTEKNETVARYSVLNDRKQIFASKYMLCLPTEEQLRMEVEKERRLIETVRQEADHG